MAKRKKSVAKPPGSSRATPQGRSGRVSSAGVPSTSSSARHKKSVRLPPVEKKHHAREYTKIFLKQPTVTSTAASPTFSFQEVTQELAQVPESLEIHPTKAAPSLAEVENRIAREKEAEKLKFFSVPIKIYEPDEKTGMVDLQRVKLTEEDKVDLGRYGARVVMTEDGRVAAVEVDKELVRNQFKKKQLHGELCQCVEEEYEISDELKYDPKTRRHFMAKVLGFEIFMRLPSLFTMYYQQHQ